MVELDDPVFASFVNAHLLFLFLFFLKGTILPDSPKDNGYMIENNI